MVGPVAFCVVVLKSEERSVVEKLRDLNQESKNVDEAYHNNVLSGGKYLSVNDKEEPMNGYSSNSPDRGEDKGIEERVYEEGVEPGIS